MVSFNLLLASSALSSINHMQICMFFLLEIQGQLMKETDMKQQEKRLNLIGRAAHTFQTLPL